MYYIPEYFGPQELFSKKVIKNHSVGNNVLTSIWRLMDYKVLWTIDKLRYLFGTIIINDYSFGGNNQYRGFRDPIELIDIPHFQLTNELKTTFSSFTSQHCFGRAVDLTIKKLFAEEVRQYIIKNKNKEEFKYITAIEKDASWFHFDVRNFKGLLIF